MVSGEDALMQMDLFIPEPDIKAGTTLSGQPVWYDRRNCRWTTDPADLFLTEDELLRKYGSSVRAKNGR